MPVTAARCFPEFGAGPGEGRSGLSSISAAGLRMGLSACMDCDAGHTSALAFYATLHQMQGDNLRLS